MPVFLSILLLLVLALAAFFFCRKRALAAVGGNPRDLHSLPNYYGWHGAIMVALPAFIGLAMWLIIQPLVIEARITSLFSADTTATASSVDLLMSDVRRVAGGLDAAVAAGSMSAKDAVDLAATADVRAKLADIGVALGADVSPEILAASQSYREITATAAVLRTAL